MSQKSIEEQFNEMINDCIEREETYKDINRAASDELLEIGKELAHQNFMSKQCEERMREKFKMQLNAEKEHEKMKKTKSFKKVITGTVAVAVLGIMMTQTTFGQNIIASVIKTFTTGNTKVMLMDAKAEEAEQLVLAQKLASEPMPAEYKGKLFDKNGKELEHFPIERKGVYNKNGEPVAYIQDGNVYTEEEWDAMMKDDVIIITDKNKINDYMKFKVTLPEYLPEGIKFEKAGVFKDKENKDNAKDKECIELYFTNKEGKVAFYLQERMNTPEWGIETGTSNEVKEVDINGAKGLRYDNSLDWETKDIIYLLHIKDNHLSEDEVMKFAKSFK